MRILYYDIIATQGVHTGFNAAMINVLYLSKHGKISSIELYSEIEHGKIVSELLKQQGIGINYKHCVLLNKKLMVGWKTLARDFFGALYVICAFIKKRKNDILFWGLAYPVSLQFIGLCARITKKYAFVCLHGELEVFVKNNNYTRNKTYFSLMKKCIRKNNKFIHYIVLGEPVFEAVRHIFPASQKPIVINHPYIFPEYRNTNLEFSPLVLGMIGSGHVGKGVQYLFEIARNMKDAIDSGKVKFILVGKLDPSLHHLDEGLVEYQKDIVDPNQFEALIKKIHFTLQLRDSNTGKATASGSLLDSLRYNKPFFSLKNNYIDFYLNQADISDMTYMSIDDIICKIRVFLSLSKTERQSEYVNFQNKLSTLKILFNIKYNSELLSPFLYSGNY
jgi:glycosyltransferase involved in cell wall biosynthesis